MSHNVQPHVLMVEDEEAIRELVSLHLKLAGLRFHRR
jgi:DNA-binding response OmpR family regulator